MLEHDRKIAAILAADVVDYSRLMGIDEEGTLAALNLRRAIFDRLVADCGGCEFGSVGDSLMAQFPSAVNALRCAQAIQQRTAAENASLPPERRMHLRIGVNLGDVIERDGTVFGDAVNVAARLQGLARPGGVLISGAVHDQVRSKLAVRFIDTGARQVKNIAEPVRTFEVLPAEPLGLAGRLSEFLAHVVSRRVRLAAANAIVVVAAIALGFLWREISASYDTPRFGAVSTSLDARLAPYALPSANERTSVTNQPSRTIAVLPFVNMSGDPDNDYFCDGLSEEVLNMLAGIHGLQVAARTSSFYFKGKSEQPEVIGRVLGVNHLLEGSVRKSGPHVRITAQLVDARNGYRVWSQTFDRQLEDVLGIQEEIARSVASSLRVRLLPADAAHVAKHGTQDPEAHRLYLIARGKLQERGLANLRAAKTLFENAIRREANYPEAYAGVADTYFLLMVNHSEELQNGEERGRAAIERALMLNPNSSEAFVSRANFERIRYERHGEDDGKARALADYRRAIELDPTNAKAYHWNAVLIREDEPDKSLELSQRAVELDPLERVFRLSIAQIFMYRGQYTDARKHLQEVIDRYPDYDGAYGDAALLEHAYGHLVKARALWMKAYELAPEPYKASQIHLLSSDLGDRATAEEWLPRITGNPISELDREVTRLLVGKRGREVSALLERAIDAGVEDDWIFLSAAHWSLVLGNPTRAIARLRQRFPELSANDSQINYLSCDAAIALAASWQRTDQDAQARRLLERIASWLDSSRAPRLPSRLVARAQVHALLGDENRAIQALNRAYDAGFRFTDASSLFPYAMDGEDNPLFASLRGDPRLVAWFARIRTDNARQLTQLNTAARTGS